MKFSIICVYNNRKILDKWLLSSLKKQIFTNYELILVDNTSNSFDSMTDALNYAGEKASGDYLMFVHQDVYLIGNDWLKKSITYLKTLDKLGVAGVIGLTDKKDLLKPQRRINVIYHGYPPSKVEKCGNLIKYPTEVQTLDEMLLIVPKKVFDKIRFDSKLRGWHLYAVDYCLSVKVYLGLKVFVLPLRVWHRSKGRPLDESYFNSLRYIIQKFGRYFDKIYTTCGIWPTTGIKASLKINLIKTLSTLIKILRIHKMLLFLPRHIRDLIFFILL